MARCVWAHGHVHAMEKQNQNLLTCCVRLPRSFVRLLYVLQLNEYVWICIQFQWKENSVKRKPRRINVQIRAAQFYKREKGAFACKHTSSRSGSRSSSNLKIGIDRPIRFERGSMQYMYLLRNEYIFLVCYSIFMLHHPISIWIPAEEKTQTNKKKKQKRKIVDRNTLF